MPCWFFIMNTAEGQHTGMPITKHNLRPIETSWFGGVLRAPVCKPDVGANGQAIADHVEDSNKDGQCVANRPSIGDKDTQTDLWTEERGNVLAMSTQPKTNLRFHYESQANDSAHISERWTPELWIEVTVSLDLCAALVLRGHRKSWCSIFHALSRLHTPSLKSSFRWSICLMTATLLYFNRLLCRICLFLKTTISRGLHTLVSVFQVLEGLYPKYFEVHTPKFHSMMDSGLGRNLPSNMQDLHCRFQPSLH